MNWEKKLFGLLLVVIMILAIAPLSALAADGADMIIVYAQAPEDWTGVCLWAWDADGNNAFDAWPGGAMTADENNPGWYYCYIPSSMSSIIINGNEGTVQTSDYTIESKNVWAVIEPEGEGFAATVSYDQMTEGDIPEYVPNITVYAQAPADWVGVSLWAWSAPDGTNAFLNWPGQEMTASPDGWYSCEVPAWVNSVIINGNAGTVQTTDISIESKDAWIIVSDADNYELSYEKPAIEEETFTVHAKAPDDWLLVSLWAWSAPDGTNVFLNWPGQEMTETDGWFSYDVPTWVNSIIINANAGTVQTTDISVEAKDLWVVVKDAENYELYYEEPAATDETPAATVAPDEAPAEETSAAPAADNTWLWIVIGAAAVVVVAVVIGLAVAKKRKKA